MSNPEPAGTVTAPKPPLSRRILRELPWLVLIAAVYWIMSDRQAPALEVGAQVPALSWRSVGDAQELRMADHAGTPMVLVFWAPWCGVCRTELPLLRSLQDDLGDRAKVIGVAMSGTTEAIEEFAVEYGRGMPHVYADARTESLMGIRAFPTIFVLDAEHRVKARYVGFTTPMRIRLAVP
jgi:cytochrome c biogenesis protein CcmG, thiol:disulfide interchange protein DsbE